MCSGSAAAGQQACCCRPVLGFSPSCLKSACVSVPWIFAWTQTRFALPVWLGMGEAFEASFCLLPVRFHCGDVYLPCCSKARMAFGSQDDIQIVTCSSKRAQSMWCFSGRSYIMLQALQAQGTPDLLQEMYQLLNPRSSTNTNLLPALLHAQALYMSARHKPHAEQAMEKQGKLDLLQQIPTFPPSPPSLCQNNALDVKH